MPKIGIIRGTGESYIATGLIIKLIKAINARFRVSIKTVEIPLCNRELYGFELTQEALDIIKGCDVLFTGDLSGTLKDIEYDNEEIAFRLGNNIKSLRVRGAGEFSLIDLCVSAYFDGGSKMREGSQTVDGCIDTRICSTTTAMKVVKSICSISEKRGRRMYFVKDSENEFSANMFYRYFESYILPQSNFHLYKCTPWELFNEIFINERRLDTVFSSMSTMDSIYAAYKHIMKNNFFGYFCYGDSLPVYEIRSNCANISFDGETPTLPSYVCALSDLLYACFNMRKEQVHLKCILENVIEQGYTGENGKEFILKIKEGLAKPVGRQLQ